MSKKQAVSRWTLYLCDYNEACLAYHMPNLTQMTALAAFLGAISLFNRLDAFRTLNRLPGVMLHGTDALVKLLLSSTFQAGANYLCIHRQNLSNPDLRFIDVPGHKLIVYAQGQLFRRVGFSGSAEYDSDRYGTQTADFLVVNAKAPVRLQRYVSLTGGVHNIV